MRLALAVLLTFAQGTTYPCWPTCAPLPANTTVTLTQVLSDTQLVAVDVLVSLNGEPARIRPVTITMGILRLWVKQSAEGK